jgi:hypothetical protein
MTTPVTVTTIAPTNNQGQCLIKKLGAFSEIGGVGKTSLDKSIAGAGAADTVGVFPGLGIGAVIAFTAGSIETGAGKCTITGFLKYISSKDNGLV